MKYIIKNCPNYWYINRAIPECGLTYKVSGFKGETETYEYCKDISDCLLKQIVEKCKSRPENLFDCSYLFAKELLDLIEIEEE